MRYTVVRDYYVAEFDVRLLAGDVIQDGQGEPDLVAELVSSGVLEPEYIPAQEFFDDEDLIDDDDDIDEEDLIDEGED